MWTSVGIGTAVAGAAVAGLACWGPDAWQVAGVLAALGALAALHKVTVRVRADAYGVHSWTLVRRWSAPWSEVVDLRVHLKHEKSHRVQLARRLGVELRGGRRRLLPAPASWTAEDPEFDAELDALRALHRRHGVPKSGHLPLVSSRTAGRGLAGPLSLCALLLVGAGLAAWCVPLAASAQREWEAAVPCTTRTPASERGDCLSTSPAVIESTEVNGPKQRSWLFFADGRPQTKLSVSQDTASAFHPGDRVEVTLWRGTVRQVTGEHEVWHEHVIAGGEVAVFAAVLALTAGRPGAQVLLRLRGRRLPADEVLPSARPFAVVLIGTALWLLPLCYFHPTSLPATPSVTAWVVAGSLVTLSLSVRAWRATRVRTPAEDRSGGGPVARGAAEPEDVFLTARFLEHTDYNPHGFGTHIVLGGGQPAVTPHSGPGRFAAKRIPVERLTVRAVRRARGGDGDTVPRRWHIAELDDAGTAVRLSAAPDDLQRILRALALDPASAHNTPAGP